MNDPTRKKRLINFVFVLNGFLFLLGGAGLINDGKLTIGMFQIFAGLLNLVMLSSILTDKTRSFLSGLILLMNIIVAGSIAYDYHISDANYIQYAWVVAAIFSFLAFIIYLKKN